MKDGLIRSGEFGETTSTGVDNESAKVKLAALLPGVARWTHLALNGVPNEIIEVSRKTMHCATVLTLPDRGSPNYEKCRATRRLCSLHLRGSWDLTLDY
jgi:hypothetical protein